MALKFFGIATFACAFTLIAAPHAHADEDDTHAWQLIEELELDLASPFTGMEARR